MSAPSTSSPKVTKEKNDELHGYPFSVHFSELLFTLLPFGVILIVSIHQKKPLNTLIYAPEWSFAATILFGQTIVKVAQGLVEQANSRQGAIAERVGLLIAIFIVLGLVPSLIVLTLILTSQTPAEWLAIAQIILFAFATFFFVLLGALSHDAATRARGNPKA